MTKCKALTASAVKGLTKIKLNDKCDLRKLTWLLRFSIYTVSQKSKKMKSSADVEENAIILHFNRL